MKFLRKFSINATTCGAIIGATLQFVFATSTSHADDPVPNPATDCHMHGGWYQSDGDGIPDIIETGDDADGDGIPNYLDEDSDNDGIPDQQEHTANWLLTNQDVNQDGIDDGYQDLNALPAPSSNDPEGDGVMNYWLPRDRDYDGIPDYLDEDSDNDGLLDINEASYNGIVDWVDTDKDMLSDGEEVTWGTRLDTKDTDGGGVWDGMEVWLGLDPTNGSDDFSGNGDDDVDNDGIPNGVEGMGDADGDRLPNMYDSDSDNDGWFDIREAGFPDIDDDGMVDDATDLNGNGLADTQEGIVIVLTDTDGDGIVDIHDRDADNDGILDENEIHAFDRFWAAGLDPFDIDADGLNNNIDLDMDGDGINDMADLGLDIQVVDKDGNGIHDHMQDLDQDGIPDESDITFQTGATDSDGDGIIDEHDFSHNEGPSWLYGSVKDRDLDDIIDKVDLDFDNDGVVDRAVHSSSPLVDADGDGIIELADSDDTVPLAGPIPPQGFYTHSTYVELPVVQKNEPPAVPVLYPVEPYNPCPDVVIGVDNEEVDPDETDTDGPGGNPLPQTETPVEMPIDNSGNPPVPQGTGDEGMVDLPQPPAQNPSTAAEPQAGAAVQQPATSANSGGSGSLDWLVLLVFGSGLARSRRLASH